MFQLKFRFRSFVVVLAVLCFLSSLFLVSASDATSSLISETENDAIFIPTGPSARASDPNYNLYSSKTNLFDDNNILRGCKGWTRLTNKDTGSDQIWHYTNASAEEAGGIEHLSGRKWGYGQVWASTGILKNVPVWHTWIYYGY